MREQLALELARPFVGSDGPALSRRSGDQTTVCLLSTGSRTVVVKRHRLRRSFEQERRALRDWAPQLPCRVPTVLSVHERKCLLVLGGLAGASVTPSSVGRASETAGAALRALHRLAVRDQDDRPLAQAMEMRRARALQAASPFLDERWLDEARALFETTPPPPGPRVPCHRDFTPHNWLWDPGLGFGLLDFEHARLDHPLVDWVRAVETAGSLQPRAAASLLRGYGEPPGSPAQCRAQSVLHWLVTVAWNGSRGRLTALRVAQARLQASLSAQSSWGT